MKKVMFITALALGFVSNAQVSEVEYIYNKRTNDTAGYIIPKTKEFYITKSITEYELQNYRNLYWDYHVKLAPNVQFEKPKMVQNFKDKGPIMMWFAPSDTTLTQGHYLVKSGQYKNASITVAGVTTGLTALILSNPPRNITEYNMQARMAGIISLIGGGISLSLNIAGNNMLIKAGLATTK